MLSLISRTCLSTRPKNPSSYGPISNTLILERLYLVRFPPHVTFIVFPSVSRPSVSFHGDGVARYNAYNFRGSRTRTCDCTRHTRFVGIIPHRESRGAPRKTRSDTRYLRTCNEVGQVLPVTEVELHQDW